MKSLFLDTKIDYVCDPVLLNDSKRYDLIKNKRIIAEDYVLVYMAQIPNTEKMNEIIKKVKETFDIKVVLIGSYRNRCDSDIHMRDVDPGDFLSLIYYASYIISNSFHATMFSLIYEKEFLSILPDKNGARIKEILDKVGLASNYMNIDDDIEIPRIENYDLVNIELNKFRDFSRNKLLENILGTKHE